MIHHPSPAQQCLVQPPNQPPTSRISCMAAPRSFWKRKGGPSDNPATLSPGARSSSSSSSCSSLHQTRGRWRQSVVVGARPSIAYHSTYCSRRGEASAAGGSTAFAPAASSLRRPLTMGTKAPVCHVIMYWGVRGGWVGEAVDR